MLPGIGLGALARVELMLSWSKDSFIARGVWPNKFHERFTYAAVNLCIPLSSNSQIMEGESKTNLNVQ